MGLIKEPAGVDFVVGPSILTEKDKKEISEIIAEYKRTGKIPVKLVKTRLIARRRANLVKIVAKKVDLDL